MTRAELTAHYATLIADLEYAFECGNGDEAVASVLAEHDREIVALANANDAAAVARAREARAAEISAWLRLHGKVWSPSEQALHNLLADKIDEGIF